MVCVHGPGTGFAAFHFGLQAPPDHPAVPVVTGRYYTPLGTQLDQIRISCLRKCPWILPLFRGVDKVLDVIKCWNSLLQFIFVRWGSRVRDWNRNA